MTTTTGGVLGAGGETQSSAGARSDSARRLGSSGTEVPIWHRSGNSPVGQSTWPSDGHSTPKGRPQNDKDMTSRRAGPSARFCSSAPQPHHAEEVARTSLACVGGGHRQEEGAEDGATRQGVEPAPPHRSCQKPSPRRLGQAWVPESRGAMTTTPRKSGVSAFFPKGRGDSLREWGVTIGGLIGSACSHCAASGAAG